MKFTANGLTYVVPDERVPELLTRLVSKPDVYHLDGHGNKTRVEGPNDENNRRRITILATSVFDQKTQKFLKFRPTGTAAANNVVETAKKLIGEYT